MKQYPILIEKIQLPGVREKKAEAMKIAEQTIMTKMGVAPRKQELPKRLPIWNPNLKRKLTDGTKIENNKILFIHESRIFTN